MKNLKNAGHVLRALRINTRSSIPALREAMVQRMLSGKGGFGTHRYGVSQRDW
jgi:hypothetical protein